MKKKISMLKKLSLFTGAIAVVLSFPSNSYAYTFDNSNIRVCVSGCGEILGAVGLYTTWDYVDDSYVGCADYSLIFQPENNTSCTFKNVNDSGYQGSNAWANVQAEYFAINEDGCVEVGVLINSCDSYGETDNTINHRSYCTQ